MPRTFGNPDRVGDIFNKGAFTDTLSAFIKDGFSPVGHDWGGLPIGYITEAYEDDHGLFVKGEYHSTTAAQDARKVVKERLAAKKTAGLSIGFKGQRYEPINPDRPYGPRRYKQVYLYEVSQVSMPCNTLAGITGAKGLHGLPEDFDEAFNLVARSLDAMEGVGELDEELRAKLVGFRDELTKKLTPVAVAQKASTTEISTALLRAMQTEAYAASLLS